MLWKWMVLTFCMINLYPEANATEDSIFLYNGQILIGDISGAQLGEITIDDIDLGDQQVKLYKIKRLITSRRFRIETHTKKVYFGIVKESEKEGWATIIRDNDQAIQIEIQAFITMIALEKKFIQQLNGNLSAGFSYTKSSDLGQLNMSTTIQYASELFQYQLSASMIASIDSSEFSRDREDAAIFTAYSFKPAWFAAVNLSYQRNLELSIARRYQQLIGGGNKLLVRKDLVLMVISGLTFNQEKSTSGESKGLLLEIPLMLRFNFFKYNHPNIQITSSQSMYYSLSQKGRFRFDSNTSFTWQLIHDFHLVINPYANFDNQPPDGSSNIDYGIAISISYKF